MEAYMYSWVGKINILQVPILPKTVCKFSAILLKVPMAFCTELEHVTLESRGNH